MAWDFKEKVVQEVASGRLKVVCNGVSSQILPGKYFFKKHYFPKKTQNGLD